MANNVIILGITPITAPIFNEEFPQLTKVNVEPYAISYSNRLPLSLKLIFDIPRLLKVVNKEHRQLKEWVKTYHIDTVISDNRLGLYHQQVTSIYITHQLTIQAGWLSGIANRVHHAYIKRFDKVWVPDFEDKAKSLSGKLSQNIFLSPINYIGPLSRLNQKQGLTEEFDYLFLLSGPEPHRTSFETTLVSIAKTSTKKVALVKGTLRRLNVVYPDNVMVYDLPNAETLSRLIINAKMVVCRSGYSTLMDLFVLRQQNIILVPTPGQKEQEYLACYWHKKYQVKYVLQKHLKDLVLD